MATFDEFMQAARRADAAGDEDAARRLVQAAVKVRDTAPERPVAEPVAPESTEPLAVEYATQDEAVPTFELEGGPQTVETEAELPPFELPRQEPERLPATFRPVEETRKGIEELVDERVQAILEERDELVTDATRAEAEARRRVEADIARQRGRMVIAGREDKPVEPTAFLPMGRPTRIVNRRVRAQAGEDFEGFLTDQVERLYRDPDTGALRKPSPFEELVETFAAQPLMNRSRSPGRRRTAASAEGSNPRTHAGGREGRLRRSAARRPRYVFRSHDCRCGRIGHEDRRRDGRRIRKCARRDPAKCAGLSFGGPSGGLFLRCGRRRPTGRPRIAPRTMSHGFVRVSACRPSLRAFRPLPAQCRRLRRFRCPALPSSKDAATPSAPTPKHGVPGRRSTRLRFSTTLRDGSQPKPSGLREPSQNDRGMGDDFVDSPEVRAAYVDLYGDPDAAYWAGTLADVFVPAGPGTAVSHG